VTPDLCERLGRTEHPTVGAGNIPGTRPTNHLDTQSERREPSAGQAGTQDSRRYATGPGHTRMGGHEHKLIIPAGSRRRRPLPGGVIIVLCQKAVANVHTCCTASANRFP
jgi:hypothetical protein